MPSIVMILVATIAQTATNDNLQLSAVTVSFVIMKILEYSFRCVVNEMVRENESLCAKFENDSDDIFCFCSFHLYIIFCSFVY